MLSQWIASYLLEQWTAIRDVKVKLLLPAGIVRRTPTRDSHPDSLIYAVSCLLEQDEFTAKHVCTIQAQRRARSHHITARQLEGHLCLKPGQLAHITALSRRRRRFRRWFHGPPRRRLRQLVLDLPLLLLLLLQLFQLRF
jgi:hypothetical protein